MVNEKLQSIKKEDSVVIEKYNFLSLSSGDIITCIDGKQYSFIKHCRVNFRAKNLLDEKVYAIPNTWYVDLVKKEKKTKKELNWYSSLKKGDKFYVLNNKRNCLLFIFEGIQNKRILGKHIIDGSITTIPLSFQGAKL